MDELLLHIENFRSLSKLDSTSLRPLTILVGENSAGKSTFLAAASLILRNTEFPFALDFNSYPFELGSYDTIATNKGGRYGSAKEFTLGYEQHVGKKHKAVYASFKKYKGMPRLFEVGVTTSRLNLSLTRGDIAGNDWTGTFNMSGKEYELKGKLPPEGITLDIAVLSLMTATERDSVMDAKGGFGVLYSELVAIRTPDIWSMAPLRIRPKRTYDKPFTRFSAEGEHTPYQIASVLEDEGSPVAENLLNALSKFGRESGLFKGITVNRYGNSSSEPFQIAVNVHRKAFNLIDVGYGVSQALPLVYESIISENETWCFFQQPEVHLHPRAQAALGSFFVDILAKNEKGFVIETHSDYIIDRVRQHVAKGDIPKEKVLILYFERNAYNTEVHSITLDDLGNILDAPPSYRAFFLVEDEKLFSRGG